MDDDRLSDLLEVIAPNGRLEDRDVRFLRDHVFLRGVVTSQDASLLIALNRIITRRSTSWNSYFCQTVCGFLIDYCYPQGSMDDVNADWLVRAISKQGVVGNASELDLLLHVLEQAKVVPETLSALAVNQVRLGLMAGVQRKDAAQFNVLTRILTLVSHRDGRSPPAVERSAPESSGRLHVMPRSLNAA